MGNAFNKPIRALVKQFFEMWPTLLIRFKKGPLKTVEDVIEFSQTRAAYVAQTSLYGYLKTRMGMKYAAIFQDDKFAPSLATAKWSVFASCLSDLTIFSVATVFDQSECSEDEAIDLARHCFINAARQTIDDKEFTELLEKSIENFNRRTLSTNWTNAAIGENSFRQSPEDIVEYAPVLDELKELDTEIVVNSTRFRWRDVREQYRKRVEGMSIINDWRSTNSRLSTC